MTMPVIDIQYVTRRENCLSLLLYDLMYQNKPMVPVQYLYCYSLKGHPMKLTIKATSCQTVLINSWMNSKRHFKGHSLSQECSFSTLTKERLRLGH